MTDGICVSTTHRVLSPPAGSGPRFSIPFFQGVSYDATFESMDVPEEVKALKRDNAKKESRKDDVEMTFKKGSAFKRLGEATLLNRVKVSSFFPPRQKIVLMPLRELVTPRRRGEVLSRPFEGRQGARETGTAAVTIRGGNT